MCYGAIREPRREELPLVSVGPDFDVLISAEVQRVEREHLGARRPIQIRPPRRRDVSCLIAGAACLGVGCLVAIPALAFDCWPAVALAAAMCVCGLGALLWGGRRERT